MRLFIAAELPDPMLDALAETSASLRAGVRGRYVGSDLFHVTLAFLGEVDGARVAAIEELLVDACAGHAPFETSLGALGSFGKKSRATLWQGFTETAGFKALARDVRNGLQSAGFEFDRKGFIPHVTLMRNADLASGTLPMPAVATGTIETVTLFSSDLSGPRPVYEALASVRLG